MNKISKNKLGFTLIELLVVVAIIAIMTGLIMASLASSRAKARDAKRISDVAQLQLALEQYFSQHNAYPARGGLEAALVSKYISALPKDPLTGSANGYIEYSTENDATNYDYTLKVLTEKSVSDGLGGERKGFQCATTDANGYFVYCVEPK